MLLSTKNLVGYGISAEDGEIGKVVSFLFDDRLWAVRYLVVSGIRSIRPGQPREYEKRLYDCHGRPAYWNDG